MSERRAGTYARERYNRGLRSYRRRMRPYVLTAAILAFVTICALVFLRDEDMISFLAGTVAGGLVAMATILRDEPPQFVQNWGRGADGERRTERTLAPLVRDGWKARHDVDLGLGNADHLLLSPGGRAFMLETKTLIGALTYDDGDLVARFADDPGETRRYALRGPVAATTRRVEIEWTRRTGRPAPLILSVVVVWGSFDAEVVRDERMTVVVGERLVETLRTLDTTDTTDDPP